MLVTPSREPMEGSRRGGASALPIPHRWAHHTSMGPAPHRDATVHRGLGALGHGRAARLLPTQEPTTPPDRTARTPPSAPRCWRQTVASIASTPGAETPCPTLPAPRARAHPPAMRYRRDGGRRPFGRHRRAVRADSLRLLVPTSARPRHPPRRGPLSYAGAVTRNVPESAEALTRQTILSNLSCPRALRSPPPHPLPWGAGPVTFGGHPGHLPSGSARPP